MVQVDLNGLIATIAPGTRLLGFDLGEKTIGLALSDTLLTIATPLETLKRGKFSVDAPLVEAIIAKQGVGGLVIGLPLNMDGERRAIGAIGTRGSVAISRRGLPCPSCFRMSACPPPRSRER